MNNEEAAHLAIEHYRRGDFAQSEIICREILREQSQNARVLHLLGVICYLSQRHDSAIKYIEEALRLNPTDAEAHYNCGNAFKEREQFDEAAACYQRALQFDPHSACALINLGYVLHRKGDSDEAVKCYQEALKREPDNEMAHFNLGNAYLDLGLLDEAVQHYQTALAINPRNSDACDYLAGIFREKGLSDEAVRYCQRALALDPCDAGALNCLGEIFQDRGRLDDAISCYQKAVQVDPNLIVYNSVFLANAKGVIHVGGNLGQERDLYAAYGLDVIWIEPIPELFGKLSTLIGPYPAQKAFRYLVTDVDDKEYLFHISNKGGGASSIYGLAGHKHLWPDVAHTGTITLKSITLSSLVLKESIDLTGYDVLVLDTQGSELLVLNGAIGTLPRFKYVRAEVADFEAYAGCCTLTEMDEFFEQHGFCRIAKGMFAHKKNVGSYYDVLYRREAVTQRR